MDGGWGRVVCAKVLRRRDGRGVAAGVREDDDARGCAGVGGGGWTGGRGVERGEVGGEFVCEMIAVGGALRGLDARGGMSGMGRVGRVESSVDLDAATCCGRGVYSNVRVQYCTGCARTGGSLYGGWHFQVGVVPVL